MQRDLLKRDLVQLDWEVAAQDEFFNRMSDRLLGLGYVEESFPAAVKARERAYPTALPTQPEAIAIPHSAPARVGRACAEIGSVPARDRFSSAPRSVRLRRERK